MYRLPSNIPSLLQGKHGFHWTIFKEVHGHWTISCEGILHLVAPKPVRTFQLRAGIHLRSWEKWDGHCVDFHETLDWWIACCTRQLWQISWKSYKIFRADTRSGWDADGRTDTFSTKGVQFFIFTEERLVYFYLFMYLFIYLFAPD
jgi:hypothetical protein